MTYESSGKRIRASVICCSCDIPAAQKLCGHISARVACHRCSKTAQYNDQNQPNFGGFDDIDEWFVERDVEQIRKDAKDWLNCSTKDARKNHIHNTTLVGNVSAFIFRSDTISCSRSNALFVPWYCKVDCNVRVDRRRTFNFK